MPNRRSRRLHAIDRGLEAPLTRWFLLLLDRPQGRVPGRPAGPAHVTRNGNVFRFKYYFAACPFAMTPPGTSPRSEFFDQPKIKAVGRREIDRHVGAAAPYADSASRSLIIHIRGRREQRLNRQRSRARCDRLQKPQPLVVRLRDGSERRRVEAV